jgi:hypothetical protein
MLYTFLNLETTVSVQMQPMVAHFEEGSERNLQTKKFNTGTFMHTIFPTYMMKCLSMTQTQWERCQTHPEPIQYSELCCIFLALLNSNEFPNTNGHPIF